MNQKKIGTFLKELRKEKGITQEELAEHLNVSSRSVSRWETGNNMPDISLLVDIADFYDVDVREIIEGERKNEMNEELREVADKMADYANTEKSKLLLGIQISGIIGILLSVFAIVLQIVTYEPNIVRFFAIIVSFIIFVLISVMTLYVTGVLNKIVKKKKLMLIVKIMIIGCLIFVVGRMLIFGFAVVLLLADSMLAKKEVYNDTAMYSEFFVLGKNKYNHTQSDEMFNIFPESIDGLDVKEFQYMYYNPWDPQYITYLTVDYDDAAYEAEIERLSKIGVGEYEGIYSVTDEVPGYDLAALISDEYYGFTYAIIPEDSEGTEITYVGIWFCNYFLDVDVKDYIKSEYLLEGFDASNSNPYRDEMLKKLQAESGL